MNNKYKQKLNKGCQPKNEDEFKLSKVAVLFQVLLLACYALGDSRRCSIFFCDLFYFSIVVIQIIAFGDTMVDELRGGG